MHIASIGIDLGETTFHLVAPGEHNKILLRRKFTRSQLLAYTANLPASLIGLEAKAPSQAIATHRRVYRIEDTQATDVCNAAHRDRIAQILNLALLVGERRSRV